MEHHNKQSIKKLIESGKYDLDLISFELDIPMEQLNKYKKEIEEEKRTKTTSKSIREKYVVDPKSIETPKQPKEQQSKNNYKKIQYMRDRYRILTQTKKKYSSNIAKQDPDRDTKKIDMKILEIDSNIKEAQSIKEEKQKITEFKEILRQIVEVEKEQLTIKQAEKVIEILDIVRNQMLGYLLVAKKRAVFKSIEDKAYNKLAEEIQTISSRTENLEELEKLNNKLVNAQSVKAQKIHYNISSKIKELKKKEIIARNKNNISEVTKSIISALAGGKIENIEELQKQICEEAKRNLEEKGKAVTETTIDNEKKQILSKIGNQLKEKSEEYPIVNCKKTLEELYQLNGNIVNSLDIVAMNLVETGKFDDANQICSEYLKPKYNGQVNFKNIISIRNRVRKAELTNIATSIINGSKNLDLEDCWLQMLEDKLDRWQIDPNSIVLGHGENYKIVTLNDIWFENDKGQR